jgi:hypothetical protein
MSMPVQSRWPTLILIAIAKLRSPVTDIALFLVVCLPTVKPDASRAGVMTLGEHSETET